MFLNWICFDAGDAAGGGAGTGSEPDDQGDKGGDTDKGKTQDGSGSSNPGVKLTADQRSFLTKSGLEPDKATPQQIVDALYKSRGEMFTELQSERKGKQEAVGKLQGLELEKILGVTELDETAKATLHSVITRSRAYEETLELMQTDGHLPEGVVKILKLGNTDAVKAVLANLPKGTTFGTDPEALKEQHFAEFKQKFGILEDEGGNGSGGAGGDSGAKRGSLQQEMSKKTGSFLGALGGGPAKK